MKAFSIEVVWLNLMRKLQLSETMSLRFWKEIETAYSAHNRHYHNLQHIQFMVDKMHELQADVEDFDTMLMAIFYHDLIYKVYRKDNEEKSAQLAKFRLEEMKYPAQKINRCIELILATKLHQYADNKDNNLMVDLDLAILGTSSVQYQTYQKNIRREYSIYPDFMYNKGRKEVLHHFLAMPKIFKTNHFHNLFEKQARLNLRSELNVLS